MSRATTNGNSSDQLLNQIKQTVQYIWGQTAVFNAVMLIIIGILFSMLLSNTFTAHFNCRYIVTQSVGTDFEAPICNGFTLPGTGEFLGLFGGGSSDVGVPGLAQAVDGPLEWVRKAILWTTLVLFIGLSGFLTYIINNIKRVTQLITFNKQAWQNLLSVMRIFVTLLVLMLAAFLMYVS